MCTDRGQDLPGTIQITTKKSWRQRYCEGWRAGAAASCIAAALVLLINVITTCWAVKQHPPVNGIGVLFSGNCKRAKQLNTWLQLIVNISSSMLLAASSFCMQCLTSPTRAEVDKAHSRGYSLDIGLSSVRNITAISCKRRLLWLGLGLSTMPLHFVYNSVLFLTIQANIYSAVLADHTFLNTGVYNTTYLDKIRLQKYCDPIKERLQIGNLPDPCGSKMPFQNPYQPAQIVEEALSMLHMFQETGDVEELTPLACLQAYKSQYVSARGDVLVIQSETVLPPLVYADKFDFYKTADDFGYTEYGVPPEDNQHTLIYKRIPIFSRPSIYPSFNWQCNPRLNRNCADSHTSPHEPWKPYGGDVLACLSEKVPEHCELRWNLGFAVAVLISNLAKVLCMFLTVWNHDNSGLMTIGDAIQSFLNYPDQHTKGLCMQSDYHLRLSMRLKETPPLLIQFVSRYDAMWSSSWDPKALSLVRRAYLKNQWQPRQQRWWKALSPYRWFAGLSLYLILLIVAASGMFAISNRDRETHISWRSLRETGIGQPMGNNLLSMNTSMLATVVIANTPQVCLSYVYVLMNSIYTSLITCREWTQFCRHRKTLRVSSPVGQQRSTFWLQLPYRYSIPLVVASTLMSWLTSQGFFFVKINVLDRNRLDGERTIRPESAILTCGFSPGAILLAIILGVLILLGALMLSFRRYDSDMPIASTSSAVISAACHPLENDPDAALLPVQWGVASKTRGIRHCCFSSKLVVPPTPGYVYK